MCIWDCTSTEKYIMQLGVYLVRKDQIENKCVFGMALKNKYTKPPECVDIICRTS